MTFHTPHLLSGGTNEGDSVLVSAVPSHYKVSTNFTQNKNGSVLLDRPFFISMSMDWTKRLSALGWCDLFLGHQFAELAGLIHFHHDIAAADKFTFDI